MRASLGVPIPPVILTKLVEEADAFITRSNPIGKICIDADGQEFLAYIFPLVLLLAASDSSCLNKNIAIANRAQTCELVTAINNAVAVRILYPRVKAARSHNACIWLTYQARTNLILSECWAIERTIVGAVFRAKRHVKIRPIIAGITILHPEGVALHKKDLVRFDGFIGSIAVKIRLYGDMVSVRIHEIAGRAALVGDDIYQVPVLAYFGAIAFSTVLRHHIAGRANTHEY